jgi:hypothetical protein
MPERAGMPTAIRASASAASSADQKSSDAAWTVTPANATGTE